MTRSRKLILAGAVVVALGAGGMGVAQAVSDDSDEQATGPQADQAKQAAVESVGGGRVVSIEREDEAKSAWEVEIVRTDGRHTEVDLNKDLQRVGVETDDDRAEDEGSDDD